MIPIPFSADTEEVCDAFERVWRTGEIPALAEFLAAYVGTDRDSLFVHLLDLDIDYRQRAGLKIGFEQYVEQFPDYSKQIATALRRSATEDETQAPDGKGTKPSGGATAAGAVPVKLGPYELISELGRGGMGVVYRARQRSLNRFVALKLIRSGEMADGEELQRFRREAEAAAQLDHPAIVPVYEVGADCGIVYFSMGLVEGGSLADLAADGPLAPKQAAEIVEQIAWGVDYAHRQGVIHRDLKPANILLDPHGQPRITDFGLAKRLNEEKELTATGQVLGTPAYMPPEQARGDLAQIGPASDIYSLGAILYRLLTGRPPFQAASLVETLQAVDTSDPVPPRRLVPNCPTDLETICLKCLEKSPDKRYSSALELAEDLKRWQRGEPILARRAGPAERLFKWARRNPLVAGLSTALVLALLLGTAISTIFGVNARIVSEKERKARVTAERETQRANLATEAVKKERDEVQRQKDNVQQQKDKVQQQKDEIQEQRDEIEQKKDEIQRQLDRADTTIYALHIDRAAQALETGDLPGVVKHLSHTQPEIRNWECSFLKTASDRRLKQWPLPMRNLEAIALSPDERWLALTNFSNSVGLVNLQVVDLETGKAEPSFRSFPNHDKIAQILFLADGSLLAARSWSGVTIWDWRNRRQVHKISSELDGANPGSMSITQDGKHLSIGYQGKISVYQVDEWKLLKTCTCPFSDVVEGVDLTPDGQQVVGLLVDTTDRTRAAARAKCFLALWSDSGEEPKYRHAIPFAGPIFDRAVQIHPNGRHVLCGAETVKVWDLATGDLLDSQRSSEWATNSARYVAGGKLIWSDEGKMDEGDWGHTARIWDANKRIPLLNVDIGSAKHTAVSPSGKMMVAIKSDSIECWDLRLNENRETFTGDWIMGLTWYPDGEKLAAIGLSGITVWDARTRQTQELVRAPKYRPGYSLIDISPDGKSLAATGIGNEDSGSVHLLNPTTGEQLSLLPHRANQAIFHPDGKRLVTSSFSDNQTIIWNLATREAEVKFEEGGRAAAISPNGRRLAIITKEGAVIVRDLTALKDQEPVAKLRLSDKPSLIAFTPDNQRLICGLAAQKKVIVWNLNSNQQQFELLGHSMYLMDLSVSPDGSRLATAAGAAPPESPHRDGEVKLWDLATGVEIMSLPQPGWWPRAVAFSPNGKRLAVGGQSGKVHVWSIP